MKAWREAAENLRTVGKEFAAGRRSEIEVALKQMEADAAVAEKASKDQRGGQTVMVCIGDCIDGNSRCVRSRQSSGTGGIQAGRLIGFEIAL